MLGDAAHPSTPNLGQGGCMAIEDAVILARAIIENSEIERAFRIYETLRYSRTARVVNISRHYGNIGQWKNPVAAKIRRFLVSLGSGSQAEKNYRKFVDYDPGNVEMPNTM